MKILDLINRAKSEIDYKISKFPDGQPHIKIDPAACFESDIQIVCRITSPEELYIMGLAVDTLGCVASLTVNVSYLMGGRMDRPIGHGQPASLLVSRRGFDRNWISEVRLLDPHSAHSVANLASEVYPVLLLDAVKSMELRPNSPHVIVAPDAGSTVRARRAALHLDRPLLRCHKEREPLTGQLSGFSIVDGQDSILGKSCIIVDDIIDGGGTFTGIASVLRAAGATRVVLCVTHGIFSKGFKIEGIDAIYTTDSFRSFEECEKKSIGTFDHSLNLMSNGVWFIDNYMHREVLRIHGKETTLSKDDRSSNHPHI